MYLSNRLRVIVLFAAVLFGTAEVHADWKDDIGWTKLFAEKGALLENGAGISISMSEASGAGGIYLPDSIPPTNSEFTGKTLIDASGFGGAVSSHSRTVALNFFGKTSSIAKGASNITIYQADDWIVRVLGYDDLQPLANDPLSQPFKVQNHSWIFTGSSVAEAVNILRRVDYVVNQNEITMVAGTTNENPIPQGLVQGFNTIIVGRTDGGHGAGNTTLYRPGRSRPDIVAPHQYTSFSTPMVASAATMLHQKAIGTDATRSETMRAVLLAGATKQEFPAWDRTTTRPLDEVYGAGELNVYNSYKILEAGQFAGSTTLPSSPVGEKGWDYQSGINPLGAVYYDFDIAAGHTWIDFSMILTWNMNIIDQDPSLLVFNPMEQLANFSLDFFSSTGGILGPLLDSSLAPSANTEHIYFPTLGSGRYSLRVMSDLNTDFGIAWRATAVPEPGETAMFAGVLLLLSIVVSRSLKHRRPRASAIS